MHNSTVPSLYSPRNFVLGCRLSLTSRARMTHSEAAAELAPADGKAFGRIAALLFALLAGVAILLAVIRGVGHGAPAVVERVAPVVSAYGLALTVALVLASAAGWVLFKAGRGAGRFYVRMCRIGHAHRCQEAARSPTVRCYTTQD